MAAAAKRIEEEIRGLPLEDMMALHGHLIVSIYEKEDLTNLDPDFREEILRRVQDIDSGKVQGIDAFEALQKL